MLTQSEAWSILYAKFVSAPIVGYRTATPVEVGGGSSIGSPNITVTSAEPVLLQRSSCGALRCRHLPAIRPLLRRTTLSVAST
jgi:hypothetical protein